MLTVVPVEHVAVVDRRGRHHRVLQPGVRLLVPLLDRVVARVDLRRHEREVPPFTALDRDGAALGLGLRLSWTVKDPVAATYEITDVGTGLEQLAVVTVRRHVGAATVEDVLVGSGALTQEVTDVLGEAAARWGVAIDRVEVTALSRQHG